MVAEKSERPLMESGHGVRYVTAKLCRQHQDCEFSGPKPLGLGRSQMGVHNQLWLLALSSVLIAGCSSSKSNSPPPVERDPCLDAGPAKSVEYDNCVADREASKREALRVLLDDTGVYSRQMQIVESEDNTYQCLPVWLQRHRERGGRQARNSGAGMKTQQADLRPRSCQFEGGRFKVRI